MKAILYVAGRAVRLGLPYEDTHKVLLEFDGRSLLERHAGYLATLGVDELIAVTGHHADRVEAALRAAGELHEIAVRTVFNPDFEEGSILSLAVSLPELESATESVLLMDGDVLYPIAMLERLLASRHETALLIDTTFELTDDDPVLVPIRDGRPVDFVKGWVGDADTVGESIGFFRLSLADAHAMTSATRARLAEGRRTDSYDDVIRDLVRAGRFGHEDVSGVPWIEIDFPEDVARARTVTLPAVEAWQAASRDADDSTRAVGD